MANKQIIEQLRQEAFEIAQDTGRDPNDVLSFEPNPRRIRCSGCGRRPRKNIILSSAHPVEFETGEELDDNRPAKQIQKEQIINALLPARNLLRWAKGESPLALVDNSPEQETGILWLDLRVCPMCGKRSLAN